MDRFPLLPDRRGRLYLHPQGRGRQTVVVLEVDLEGKILEE